MAFVERHEAVDLLTACVPHTSLQQRRNAKKNKTKLHHMREPMGQASQESPSCTNAPPTCAGMSYPPSGRVLEAQWRPWQDARARPGLAQGCNSVHDELSRVSVAAKWRGSEKHHLRVREERRGVAGRQAGRQTPWACRQPAEESSARGGGHCMRVPLHALQGWEPYPIRSCCRG